MVVHVVGARPNYMKVAPVYAALEQRGVEQQLVHTGQHHDGAMFGAHLADLGLPAPEISLGVSGGGHAALVGRTVQAAGEMDSLKTQINQMVFNLRDAIQRHTAARETAELANRSKSEFLANMSHEIRYVYFPSGGRL